jgi:hypothetical protein
MIKLKNMNRFIILALSLVVAGCATAPQRRELGADNKAATSSLELPTLSTNEAIRSPRSKKMSQTKAELYIKPASDAMLVDFGGYRSLAIVLEDDVPSASVIKVKSYLAKTSNGGLTLFYPLLTLVDEHGKIIRTIKPKYEFRFDKDTLINEFVLSESSKYIFVHTSPEFAQYSFVDSASINPTPSPLVSIGKAITARGGWLGPVLTSMDEQGKPQEYTLGGMGIVQIEYE